MSEMVSLSELLDLSIGTPQERSVNFGALHALLLAILKHQHLREIKTRWRDSSPGCGSPDLVAVFVPAEEEVQPDSATAVQLDLLSRIQSCEDGLSKSMSLILDLSSHSEQLKQQIEELRQQHEGAGDLLRTGRLVESCCHRVEVLEGTVESLRVAGLPGDRERFTADTPAHLQPGDSGADDQPPESPPPPSSHPDTPPPEDSTAAGKPSSSTQSPEAEQGLRSIGELQERLVQLEARVAALEGPQVDPAQLAQLGELLTITGCHGDAFRNLMDELNEQRALIDRLMTDRGTMDSLEERLMGLMGSEREESESRGSGELRERVQRLEEEVQQVKRAREERASDRQLQHQLDDLRRTLEDTISSFTSQVPTSLQDEAVQRESADRSALNAGTGEKLRLLFEHYEQLQAAVNGLIQQQEGGVSAGPPQDRESVQQAILQLQADCLRLSETSRFLQDESGERRRHIEELFRTTEELKLNKADKQMVESEIKADKSALEGKVSRLQFDSVTEQLSGLFHELLSKVTSQEQDWHKLMAQLSTEMQCKLNRIELDSVKKQLEERWRSIHEKLQAQAAPESEDAAGIRKQLVERFHCLSCDRPVLKHTPGPHLVTLPSFPAFPPHKSIRPFTVYTMEQLRQHYRSLQPGINRYNLQAANLVREQLERSQALMCLQTESLERQHSTTAAGVPHERISELADYGHLAAARSCGGRHNCNATGGQRRNVPQHPKQPKHHGQREADGALQSEEVNIVGLDGRIYKGRLNAPAFRDPETKLPTIPSRDGVCKSKDKPAASPEVGPALHQPCSPRSRSGGADSPERLSSIAASSCSGRDWPVSALGCPSQSSVTQAEPRSNEPLDL